MGAAMPSFPQAILPPGTAALRAEVRAFLDTHRTAWEPERVAQSWVGFDRSFTRAVGAKGWIGMTWPREYGGQASSMLERYVVLEEMLAVGAPIGAHSTGDRQTGPLLLRLGTEAQKQAFLPAMARGEIAVCVGLSEPNSGSDLASLRSRAEKVEGGWRLNGNKVWTTNAHQSEYMLGLFRSQGTPSDRHKGLSQFLINLASPGIEIRGIRDLTGESHFNEVFFKDVFIPDAALVGREGDGWTQVTAELAFERSGPDRFMSAYPLLEALSREPSCETSPEARRLIGEALVETAVLRNMSLSIAARLEAGETPNLEAAVVKELGVSFEQGLPELARVVVEVVEGPLDARLVRLLQSLTLLSPTFSLRGGTREIMKGIVAKGVGCQ